MKPPCQGSPDAVKQRMLLLGQTKHPLLGCRVLHPVLPAPSFTFSLSHLISLAVLNCML